MRITCAALLIFAGLGLVSCDRDYRSDRDREAARQAGRDAYRASQQVKRGAREAERDLRNAGKEFREGWEQARERDRTARPK